MRGALYTQKSRCTQIIPAQSNTCLHSYSAQLWPNGTSTVMPFAWRHSATFKCRKPPPSTVRYGVTFCIILNYFGYNIFKFAVSTDHSQGIYRSLESRSALSVNLYSLRFRYSLFNTSLPPFVKEICYSRKTPNENFPTKKVHICAPGHS